MSELDSALCEFAEKLTLKPCSVGGEDVDKLKSLGLDDRGITDAVEVVAYFNYINRIAEGLGVEPEDWMK